MNKRGRPKREKLTRHNSHQISFRVSREEYRWLCERWPRSHGTLREYVRGCVIFAMKERQQLWLRRKNPARIGQLQRVASLIWGVAAKKYDEYSEIEAEIKRAKEGSRDLEE